MPFEITHLLTVAGGLLLLCLLPFVAGPLLIYFTHTQAARPQLVPFFPGQTQLPATVDQFFSDACWALDAEGFQIVTGMFLPNQTQHVFAALVFVVNRQERVAAILVAIHAHAPGSTPVTQLYVEFNTRFRDGRVVQTNNSPVLGAFPTPEHITNSLLPSVKNPRVLYRIHGAQARLHGGESVLRLDEDFAGDAVAYLQFAMMEELERACSAGYMRLDASAGVYRPTLKGAFLMTWREMWPIKAIRLAMRARREKQLLAELTYRFPELAGIGR